MSEPRKNHLNIDGGQVKDDENVASYKPIPETDTDQEVEYLDTEEVYMQMNQPEATDADHVEVEDHWEQNSIRLMLNLYLQKLDKFRSPRVKKKNVWIEIANAVGKTPDSCDKKFRNLKQTYIRLLKRRNRHELTVVKWPYFDIFEKIYFEKGEYHPVIQMKLKEVATENVAKAFMSVGESSRLDSDVQDNGQTLKSNDRKKISKRYSDFRKISLEMRNRQRTVEEKLDRLINIVQESNNIQRERNKLFEQFLDSLHGNPLDS